MANNNPSSLPPFGHFAPTKNQAQLIEKCQSLKPSWLNKQRAQWMRKQVLKSLQHPLDLTLQGINLRCHLKDNVSERGFVFMPWRFDHLERQYMLQHLPEHGVFVDVGANVGIYSCLALRHLGPKGRVLSIEPNPQVIERLQFNLSANASNTPIHRVWTEGVSDRSGSFELHLDDDNLGASSLIKPEGATHNRHLTIACQTLLSTLYEAQIAQVDVMKVDIEGAEDLALVPFLSQANEALLPQCLIIENNSARWQLPLKDQLMASGYELVEVTRMNWVWMKTKALSQKVTFKKTQFKNNTVNLPGATRAK